MARIARVATGMRACVRKYGARVYSGGHVCTRSKPLKQRRKRTRTQGIRACSPRRLAVSNREEAADREKEENTEGQTH